MRLWPVVATVVALAAVSCSGSDPVAPDAAEPSRPASSPADETSARPAPEPSDRPFDPRRVTLRLREIVSDLSSPLGILTAGDRSGRLFVVEQTGAVRVLRRGRLAPAPFLDVTDRVVSGGEQGLLGLAFHPEFEHKGLLFVNYTDTNGDTVVAEYEAPGGRRADPASERVLLRIDQPFDNHNGGHIAFGPDGYLYIATGDGGSAGDPMGNGQRLDTLLGKLLRIDVDRSSGRLPYAVPEDNPFVNRDGARPEIWAYGLRNPWRFSFDLEAGTLWIADVGQGEFEEVNRAPLDRPGLNYGWNAMEGRDCYTSGCDREGKELPLTGYGHDAGCSVTGGFVYRGRRWPKLQGGYLFGDYCSGTLWAVQAEARGFVGPTPVFEGDLAVSSFGVGGRGELMVADLSGSVYRVTAP